MRMICRGEGVCLWMTGFFSHRCKQRILVLGGGVQVEAPGGKLDLRTIPSAVGDISKHHGIILAKSIPAKQYDIRTGETVVDAKRK